MLSHNRITLQQVEEFAEAGKNCCVVNPCGSGKTSIAAGFIANQPGKTFLIITKQKNAADYYRDKDPVFRRSNVRIVTYNRMFNDVRDRNTDAYDCDYYIIDEAHYLGADNWGAAFLRLKDMFNPILIGLTATPQRFEDEGTDNNIVKEFFDGNSAGNFTTTALQKHGVFTEPEYVLSLYNFQSLAEKKADQIMASELEEFDKERLCSRIEAALTKWQTESSPEVVFQRYLPRYMYKKKCNRILVYVPSVSEIYERKAYIDGCARKTFPGKTVESYVYTYKDPESVLKEFLDEDDVDIKILYSIDKVMETVHFDDIRIAVMLRPSCSGRIITQQFGRINSISNKQKPIIIDMVDNLRKLKQYSPEDIDEEEPEYSRENNDKSGLAGNRKPTFTGLPHYAYYANIFSSVDKALCTVKHYEYEGFKGTLRDLCYVFGRDPDDAKELIKTHDIEDTMKLARERNQQISQEIFDGFVELPEFELSEKQKKYADRNMHIVNNFISSRGIEDQDIIQNLYFTYLYQVYSTDKQFSIDSKRKIKISLNINRNYLLQCKNRVVRRKILSVMPEPFQWSYEAPDMADTLFKEYLDKHRDEEVADVLETLRPREQEIIKLYFGIGDNQPHTLDEIGKIYNLSRERVRQIQAKGLRKLRNPQRSKHLKDYLYY